MNRPQEQSYFMTPDSLRAYLNLLEKFYDEHVNKNRGFKDYTGLQYAGTIENFGGEILSESNKLKLRKPPIDSLNIGDKLKYYFNIQYSEYIETPEQQRMLCAVLKKNSLIPTWEYTLTMTNLVEKIFIRSESSSDPVVNCDRFLCTTSTPTLTVTDTEENTNTYNLIVNDGQNQTKFYFPINSTTNDMHDDIVDGTLTININQFKKDNVPYFWFCIPSFEHMPPVDIDNNDDYSGKPLLTLGSNGHDITLLFPYVQDEDNVPVDVSELPEDGKWFIKVIGDFNDNIVNDSYNYSAKIETIEYIYSTSITSEPYSVTELTYDDEFVKLILSHDVEWDFRTPNPEDEYGYDGVTYDNKTYAYIELSEFESNLLLKNLKAAFKVIFDNESYVDNTEINLTHAVSGIHFDMSTDYSNHAIYKNHGLIHELSSFDGLPLYLKTWGERNTHRGHVELYSIRDNITSTDPTERHTAAIVLDTAVPKNDISDITLDLTVVIKYQGEMLYNTTGESESTVNYLSEIGYLNNSTVANTTMIEYKDLTKFIYHTNGVFSLKTIDSDPELEIGRGYLITNDSSSYQNNGKAEDVKPARTVARICDIPTSYPQLIDVKGISPTYAYDKFYVRQHASLKNSTDKMFIAPGVTIDFDRYDLKNIWENIQDMFYSVNINGRTKYIFLSLNDLTQDIATYGIDDKYHSYLRPYPTIDMSEISIGGSDPEISIYSEGDITGGEDYELNDRISFIVGGYSIAGTVTSVDDGHVRDIEFDVDSSRIINEGNFRTNPEVYETTTLSGSGTGLKLVLTFNSGTWSAMHTTTSSSIRDPLYALVYDYVPNRNVSDIWIYKYNSTTGSFQQYQQITGSVNSQNWYDINRQEYNIDGPSKYMRMDKAVYLYNLLYHYHHTSSTFRFNEMRISSIESTEDITGTTNYASRISQTNNYDESYSYLVGESSSDYHSLQTYHMIPEDYVELPENHYLNTFVSHKSPVVLTPVFADENTQPQLYYYNPFENTSETLVNITSDKASSTLKPLTFLDVMSEVVDTNYKLKANVYSYTLWNDYVENMSSRSILDQKTYEELLEYIRSTYGELNDPCRYDGTTNQFTKAELVNYIDERRFSTPPYHHTDTKLLRSKNETVIDVYSQTPQPVGEQPRGVFTEISTERCDSHLLYNGIQRETKPLYTFRIDNESLDDLTNFRMYDDNNKDISEMCLLIINNIPYIFINNTWVAFQNN